MVNHFEHHKEITTKSSLIKNLQLFCEQNRLFLFDLTPATFLIDLDYERSENQISYFLNFYNKLFPDQQQ